MGNLPIMFFHRGKQSYLRYVIEQAEKWNEEVWLLGDESNKEFARNWIDCKNLPSEMFEVFLSRYEHMSTRTYAAEMFCFESHFRYYELAKKMGWQKFITMDSDVLVYQTMSSDIFGNADAACGWTQYDEGKIGACDPFVSYWTIDAMEEYLKFCVDVYIDGKEELQKKWKYHQDNSLSGGVCDMTLLTMWKKRTARHVKNVAEEIGGECFDINLGTSNNQFVNEYKMSKLRKVKRVKFANGIPYLYKQDGTKVRTLVLHCNGHIKKCITFYQKCINSDVPYAIINWLVRIKIAMKIMMRKWKQKRV